MQSYFCNRPFMPASAVSSASELSKAMSNFEQSRSQLGTFIVNAFVLQFWCRRPHFAQVPDYSGDERAMAGESSPGGIGLKTADPRRPSDGRACRTGHSRIVLSDAQSAVIPSFQGPPEAAFKTIRKNPKGDRGTADKIG